MIDPHNPIFQDEQKAREYLESLRWPNGPVCPHCKSENEATKLAGKTTRPGVWKCRKCWKPFTVTVKTVFERSKVPLNTWLYVTFLLCSSKKGMSSHQIHRMIGGQYRTARFMTMRVREAMRVGSFEPPMGGGGGVVEIDDTFIGRKFGTRVWRGGHVHKHAVLTLVERGGEARSFHMKDGMSGSEVVPIVRANIDRETRLMSDTAGAYTYFKAGFTSHETVNHADDEWARGEVHTNTIEGYFSIFKRGMKGVYQHCSAANLHRYLAEFDFRYSNRIALGIDDNARTEKALKRIGGRRLMYKKSTGKEATQA